VIWEHRYQYVNIAEGISEFLGENEVKFEFSYDSSTHLDVMDSLINNQSRYDGMLLTPSNSPEYKKAVMAAIHNGTKIVFMDQYIEDVPASCVSMDHARASYKLTSHMLAHNLPVWYFGYANFPSSCRERSNGWRAAMEDFGFSNVECYKWDISRYDDMSKCDTDPEPSIRPVMRAKEAALAFFEEKGCDAVKSVLCHTDGVAHGACLAAEKIGLKVGKDIFVAGFGNTPLCERLPVPLTSIEQHDKLVGYNAAKLLFEEIKDPGLSPQHSLHPFDLCIRESA
jgi:DNA-binding LacI/PurR family transcriptional regulator